MFMFTFVAAVMYLFYSTVSHIIMHKNDIFELIWSAFIAWYKFFHI